MVVYGSDFKSSKKNGFEAADSVWFWLNFNLIIVILIRYF